jgi:amidase
MSEPRATEVVGADPAVVREALDAGVTITAKLNMEDVAFSGSGELSATGPVLNPRDGGHIAGGSSSRSIAAVVAGDVDVGHKPTHGLVPYTGMPGRTRSTRAREQCRPRSTPARSPAIRTI